MRPHGGFLIAAVLVMAIATGCRRDKEPSAAAHGGPHRPAVVPPRQDITAVEAPAPPRTTTPAPASGAGPGEARDELGKLAQDARQLRHALLHADFRDANDKTKEAEDDSR